MAATSPFTTATLSYLEDDLEYCDDNYTGVYLDDDTGALNRTNGTGSNYHGFQIWDHISIIMYTIICLVGLIGNGLVIYVVVRYAKMKTVTNIYILNLAMSDVLFLISLPFLITTTILRYWIFGFALCKIFFVLYSINFFTGVFTLTVLSADRYLAVCHPVRSVKYRTPKISLFICLMVWSVSFWVMLPIILYSRTVPSATKPDKLSCQIDWPDGQPIPPDKAFTWYSCLLGFAIPMSLISVFYLSVVLRLKTVGPTKKSKERKKSNKKVTKMVLTVILVYFICWLPYWCFQVNLTFKSGNSKLPSWHVSLFHGFTILTFINSMLNPFLYAFLSENFRKSFMKAFKCASLNEVSRTLTAENSMFPRTNHTRSILLNTQTEDQIEASIMPQGSVTVNNNQAEQSSSLLNNTTSTCIEEIKLENDLTKQ